MILLLYQSAINQRHQLKIVYAWLVGDLSVTCSWSLSFSNDRKAMNLPHNNIPLSVGTYIVHLWVCICVDLLRGYLNMRKLPKLILILSIRHFSTLLCRGEKERKMCACIQCMYMYVCVCMYACMRIWKWVGRVHGPLRLSHVVCEASSFPMSDAQLPFMCVHVCVLVVIELGVYSRYGVFARG